MLPGMGVENEDGVVLTVWKHEQLERTLKPVHHVTKTELVSRSEEIDLIEPQARKQIIQGGMFSNDDGSLWHICICKVESSSQIRQISLLQKD